MGSRNFIPENILRLMDRADRMALGKCGLLREEVLLRATARREAELQRLIASLLNLRGIAFFWQRTDKRARGTTGWPDFTFSVNGLAVAFEVKLPGENPTADQAQMHERMRVNGWHVMVIRDLQGAKSSLDQLARISLRQFSVGSVS